MNLVFKKESSKIKTLIEFVNSLAKTNGDLFDISTLEEIDISENIAEDIAEDDDIEETVIMYENCTPVATFPQYGMVYAIGESDDDNDDEIYLIEASIEDEEEYVAMRKYEIDIDASDF